jgi:hypothetical protein
MMRQQPADERGSGQDDHEICAITVADDIGGAVDCLIRRAVRGRTEIQDQFIDDRI